MYVFKDADGSCVVVVCTYKIYLMYSLPVFVSTILNIRYNICVYSSWYELHVGSAFANHIIKMTVTVPKLQRVTYIGSIVWHYSEQGDICQSYDNSYATWPINETGPLLLRFITQIHDTRRWNKSELSQRSELKPCTYSFNFYVAHIVRQTWVMAY